MGCLCVCCSVLALVRNPGVKCPPVLSLQSFFSFQPTSSLRVSCLQTIIRPSLLECSYQAVTMPAKSNSAGAGPPSGGGGAGSTSTKAGEYSYKGSSTNDQVSRGHSGRGEPSHCTRAITTVPATTAPTLPTRTPTTIPIATAPTIIPTRTDPPITILARATPTTSRREILARDDGHRRSIAAPHSRKQLVGVGIALWLEYGAQGARVSINAGIL